MDDLLRFDKHVSGVCKKVYLSLKSLFPYRGLLDSNTKLTLINALIMPHFNYCDIVYGPLLTNEDRNRLQKMQNHAVRFVTSVPRFAHITPFIRDLNLLRLNEAPFVHYACFVGRILETGVPNYLYSKLTFRSNLHDRNLRDINLRLHIPEHRRSSFKSGFSYRAPLLNNVLEICNSATSSLKKRLRENIIAGHISGINLDNF